MPQISVIVPVYNVEKYVEKCVRSILDQTFHDLEVVCVDDGSTDNSLRILNKLAAEDPRVRVFSTTNQGAGLCRNKGLDEATGQYISFVDADDFLAPSACEILLRTLQQDNLDIATCWFYYCNDSGQTKPFIAGLELDHKEILDRANGDSLEEFAKFAFAITSVWGKLYRREIIENTRIRFPAGHVEDMPFSVECFLQAKRVKRIPDMLYYYRVGRTGTVSGNAERMALDGIKNFDLLEQKLRQQGVFEEIKETFWFNKMNLFIGDEKIFIGRLGNISQQALQRAYDLIREEILALPPDLFAKRNAWFRWKVRQLQKALRKNDLRFPYRLRKLRNILMVVLDPYFKLTHKKRGDSL